MSLFSTLRWIVDHPLNQHRRLQAAGDFLKWQIGSRLVPGAVVYHWVEGSRVVVRPGETGFTGNIYCGLHEFADMGYLLHVLRADDLFVDIGANVGSYTLLAASRGARGVAFEPVPSTYRRLVDNLRINDLLQWIDARNMGLAEQDGTLVFSSGENCTNHVLAEHEAGKDSVTVPVSSLDQALRGAAPAVIKLDVEGYELPVLRGAGSVLASPTLHSVIMELNGSGSRYGYDEGEIQRLMLDHGFSTHTYDPFARRLMPLDGKNEAGSNTLFIRDPEGIAARLAAGPKVQVRDTLL